jgi:hypothetical protein
MYFVLCRLYPYPQPQSKGQCLSSSYHLSTLKCGCRLAYPYDWRGFVRTKKKTSVGLLVFYPSCCTLCVDHSSFCFLGVELKAVNYVFLTSLSMFSSQYSGNSYKNEKTRDWK